VLAHRSSASSILVASHIAGQDDSVGSSL
jgi:hypothetical protein